MVILCVGLCHNIQKTKIMASGPIPSWEIDGEAVADFVFWGSKITADGDCHHEIKKRLLLGRRVMTNLDSIVKSKDITLPTRVRVEISLGGEMQWGWGCQAGERRVKDRVLEMREV